MAKYLCTISGARGRTMCLYDTKVVIKTRVTIGSILTDNYDDGEKTIFFCDVVGVQLKQPKINIGYLQFETASNQMNNRGSNYFSENSFTFVSGENIQRTMKIIYDYVVDRIEEIKYNVSIIETIPDFKSFENISRENSKTAQKMESKFEAFDFEESSEDAVEVSDEEGFSGEYIDDVCPVCQEAISYSEKCSYMTCPWCNAKIRIKN